MKNVCSGVKYSLHVAIWLKGITLEFILGLLIFIADIWAIIKTAQSPVNGVTKLLWILIILLLPFLGLLLWFFLGPPRAVRA